MLLLLTGPAVMQYNPYHSSCHLVQSILLQLSSSVTNSIQCARRNMCPRRCSRIVSEVHSLRFLEFPRPRRMPFPPVRAPLPRVACCSIPSVHILPSAGAASSAAASFAATSDRERMTASMLHRGRRTDVYEQAGNADDEHDLAGAVRTSQQSYDDEDDLVLTP